MSVQNNATLEMIQNIIDGATPPKKAETADNATNAQNAVNAQNAERATEAEHATTADSATNAQNADNAQHAERATNATHATNAINADITDKIEVLTPRETYVPDRGKIIFDAQNIVLKIGDGASEWSKLPSFKPAKYNFATDDWKTIDKLSVGGHAELFYNVGDRKEIELSTGETITLTILGFSHDELTSGGKAGITIGVIGMLPDLFKAMNSTSTNAGGWDESAMRTSEMPEILSLLPSDLQSVIKTVNKKTTAGGGSQSITTSSDKLWLLSLSEIFSATSIENSDSSAIKDYASAYNSEGTQYEYYKNIIGDNNGGTGYNSLLEMQYNSPDLGVVNTSWWTRSASISNNYGFFQFYRNQGIGTYEARYSAGIPFCFCV